ncbi:MAG TPA: DegV family protein, partial [Ktedonobacterales bacterium]
MSVRIVVDSTSDIPPERAKRLGIIVVPEIVLFGDEAFLDGVDLDGPAFYQKLATSRVMPTTSAPSPAQFEETYRQVIRDGATGVLSLHIASTFSATVSAASGAAELVTRETGVPIEVIDTGTVSGGFGLPAELVAQAARDGGSLADLKRRAVDLCQRAQVYAVLDTLEFLQRGGRIGRASALMGTLLNVKPLIAVREGQVVPVEKVRTRAKAQERLGELVARLGALEAAAVVESEAGAGEGLRAMVARHFAGPIETFALGPVVGTHAGPGAA